MSETSSETGAPGNNRLKAYYQSNPWKSRLLLVLVILFTLLLIARIVLSPSIIYGATSWLKENGIDSTIEDIRIDIFDGTVSLINATGNAGGEPLFNIGLIDIHWSWKPLSEKTVVINKVTVDNIRIDIAQYSDEIIVGGVHIPTATGSEKEPEIEQQADAKPWAASLGEVVFSNFDICYLQDSATAATTDDDSRLMDYCVTLKEMTWGGTISYATDTALVESADIPLSSTGDFQLNGLTVTDNRLGKRLIYSDANTLDKVVISGLNSIQIDALEMNALSAMHRDDEAHKDAIRFTQLVLTDIALRDLDKLSIGSITIDDPGLYIVKDNAVDWEYSQWLPGSPATSEVETATASEPSPFNLRLGPVTLNRSDFCYLDRHLDNYDCFAQKKLHWQGEIDLTTGAEDMKLSGSGDLTADNTSVYRPVLDRRLLDIVSLSLQGLNIRQPDDLSLQKLTINGFSALQRGEDQADNTIGFDKLGVDDTVFTGNKVAIDTISLAGLSSQLTKRDDDFEHDKWLKKKTPVDNEATDKPDEKAAADTTEPGIMFVIKQLNIDTDKEMVFVDQSTEPEMKIGLKKLDITVDHIDSAKPDSDTTFELDAQTLRHSTIDLAGKARPFADKISMDAKGKLKGFDLRAATPATKKAIGHIIKSGQLDADLTLLASEGVLDSNVALSLYHFNIKAESKEDAEKLDKQFGMPLNQTLVLLRDKDDSIHLDIPITGDVNNPDFNPMDAIVKATSKAATVTLITFYTPYGLAYAGGNVLFDLATALDFAPIVFNPGSSDITSIDSTPLDNMAKMMTEKPGIHLTLCGVTNKDDIGSLFPALKAKQDKAISEGKADKDIPQLNSEQKAALTKLAQERQDNSKNRLIEKYGIEHSRLILCAPEHSDDDDAISGVEINI